MSDNHSPGLGGQRAPHTSASPRLGGEAAITHIMQALAEEGSWVRRRAVDALADIGTDEATAILMEALRDENNSVVRRAVEALGRYGWPATPPPELVERLMAIWHTVPDERKWLAIVFGRMGDPRPLGLLEGAASPRVGPRLWAVAQIGWRSGDEAIRQRALRIIARYGAEASGLKLAEEFIWPPADELAAAAHALYAEGAQGERLAAAELLADLGDSTGADVLMGAFRITMAARTNPARRRLARLGNERPLHLLVERINDGEHDLLVILHRYLRERVTPISDEAQSALNLLLQNVMVALDGSLYDQEAALTILGAAGSPEADAVLYAWLDREADELLGHFAATGSLKRFNPRRLYHLVKPGALDPLREHPLIEDHALNALHLWLDRYANRELQNTLLCMGYLGAKRSLLRLITHSRPHHDAKVRAAAIKGLGRYPQALDDVLAAMVNDNGKFTVRMAGYEALGRIGVLNPYALVSAVADFLPKAEPEAGALMLRALADLRHKVAGPHLNDLLTHDEPLYRGVSAYGLGYLPHTNPDDLRPLLSDHAQVGRAVSSVVPYRVCDVAAEALARLGHSPF